MYFSPNEVANTHHQIIDHTYGTTRAFLDTTEQLAALGFRASRARIAQRVKQASELATPTLDQAPTFLPGQWLSEHQAMLAESSEELMRILIQGNQAMIDASQTNMRMLDRVLVNGIERDERSAPLELGFAFGLLKRSIWRTESTLGDLATTITKSVSSVGKQVEQVLDAVQEPATMATKASPRQRRKAA